ncbi:hypothetical protein PMZ80_002399 [Knufia obscura]|uniref:DUF985 domain-containing protein n=2 Tax=Knufia TaxID=430999 RepID=A0AAN8EFT7_9EURO|nr:hypothetical protein PMZ80_002399 [Knufia obscura]KAK5948600.1 hypothetical protein OHC33_010359 [Knufia fluminis]
MAVSLPFNQPSQSKPLGPKEIITLLDLQPHPEGGYFRQTFIDDAHPTASGRAPSTMIYFLLERGNHSNIHRIDAAEGWHFYAGQAIDVVELSRDGAVITKLGMDLARGERPQCVVRPNTWFGSKPAEGSEWALVGCTVAPGFLFEKFELGERGKLVEEFPGCREWIVALTPES